MKFLSLHFIQDDAPNMAHDTKTLNIKYEPEADVLSWEISDEPIDYATESGDLVVHFTKDQKPVLIEVLRAKSFMKNAEGVVGFQRLHPDMKLA